MKSAESVMKLAAGVATLILISGCSAQDMPAPGEETGEAAVAQIATWYKTNYLIFRTIYADGSHMVGTPRVRITTKHGGVCNKLVMGMSLVDNVTEELCLNLNLIWVARGVGGAFYCRTSTNQPGRVFSYEYSGNGQELNYNVLDWNGIRADANDQSGWIPSSGNGCDRTF